MKFPERHTCHAGARFMHLAKGEWRPPRAKARRGDGPTEYSPDIQPTRECDYCGSMHAGDLLELLRAPGVAITMEVADWKYGWPHKVYVSGVPNPLAGVPTVRSARYFRHADGVDRVELGAPSPEPPTLTEKFYTEHLLDAGYDDEAHGALVDELWKRTGIRFERRDGRLFYRCLPYGAPVPAEPT